MTIIKQLYEKELINFDAKKYHIKVHLRQITFFLSIF